MVDDQEPAKRVVRRVVKKTVVRPTSPAPAAPTVRYGRPVATAARPSAPSPPASKGSVPTAPGRPASRPKIARRRPSVDLGATAAGVRDVAGRAWWATADTVADGTGAAGRLVATRARAVAAWRLPHLNPYLASVVTGAVVGVVAVALGLGALAIFEAVRGVSAGGGLWGGISFVVLAVVVMFLGEALLRGFGSQAARLTSFLAVVLTIVAMLGLFPDAADSSAGLLVVPLLGVAAYVVSHWLVDLAENTPATVE